MYKYAPLEEKYTELDENDKVVKRVVKKQASKEIQEVLSSDTLFNQKFNLKFIRQWDLLLLSSKELDLGNAKELKAKIKTMDDLQKLLELDHVALALVRDGLQVASKSEEDTKAFVVLRIAPEKYDFFMAEQNNELDFSRFFTYHLTELSQDFKQYDAVL